MNRIQVIYFRYFVTQAFKKGWSNQSSNVTKKIGYDYNETIGANICLFTFFLNYMIAILCWNLELKVWVPMGLERIRVHQPQQLWRSDSIHHSCFSPFSQPSTFGNIAIHNTLRKNSSSILKLTNNYVWNVHVNVQL